MSADAPSLSSSDPAAAMEPDSEQVTLGRMASTIESQTATEMRDLMAHLLTGAAGGNESRWRKLIGPVEELPAWRYVRFNWRVTPSGSERERELIGKAVEVVRGEHPYIRPAVYGRAATGVGQ